MSDGEGLTFLGRCGAGLRLVSDRPKAWEWQSFPRRTQGPRYRQRALAPWQPRLSELNPCDGGETDGEAASVGGLAPRVSAIWILPRHLDRLLVLRARLGRLAQGDQVVRQIRQLRQDPAAQRDLGRLYRLSDRVDRLVRPVRLVLQSSQRAPSRQQARLLSRSA